MCGRFTSTTPPDQLARYFGAELAVPADPAADADQDPGSADRDPANYNVAPTQSIFAVVETDRRRLERLHWGLVPFWAKDPGIGNRMINARAETLAEKNSFKGPFARSRCIIPADGFYEWKKIEVPGEKKPRKQPMYLHRVDDAPFAFAGLWSIWKDRNHLDDRGEPLELHSCTIITGPPNDAVAEIHDRMPVMLPPDAWDTWLDPDNHDTESLRALFVPAPSALIAVHPVSTEVNNVRNNRPELIDPVDPIDPTSAD